MTESRNDRHGLHAVDDVIEVCLESAEENMVSAMALGASMLLDSQWNGWARPLATAAAMRDFLDRWRRNDPNGIWGDAYESDGQLVCTNTDSDDPDVFPRAGETRHGEPLYDLTGWTWVPIEGAEPGVSPTSGASRS